MKIAASNVTAIEYEIDGGTIVKNFLDVPFMATNITVSTEVGASGVTSVTVLGFPIDEAGNPKRGNGLQQIFLNLDQEHALVHWLEDNMDEQNGEISRVDLLESWNHLLRL